MAFTVLILFCLIMIEASLAAMAILVLQKYKIGDWYDLHRRSWMPDRCELCLAFWICVLTFAGFILCCFPNETVYYISPFCAAPIARFIWSI